MRCWPGTSPTSRRGRSPTHNIPSSFPNADNGGSSCPAPPTGNISCSPSLRLRRRTRISRSSWCSSRSCAAERGSISSQSDWSAAPSVKGSLLFGAADDVATFLPPTHDPFLFTISGSIARSADRAALERELKKRIATIAGQRKTGLRLDEAKAAVIRELAENVQTTEDAAHQLAFFEGVGALDALLAMPQRSRERSPRWTCSVLPGLICVWISRR